MSHAFVHDDSTRLRNPVYIDGLPGLGPVGKIVADHLFDEFDMTLFASIEWPALPPVVVALAEFDGRTFHPGALSEVPVRFRWQTDRRIQR